MPSVISLFTDTGTIVDETNGLFIQSTPDSSNFKVEVACIVSAKDIHGILDITSGGKTNLVLLNNTDALRPLGLARGLTPAWVDRLKVPFNPNPAAVVTQGSGSEVGAVSPPSTAEPSSAPATPHSAEFVDILVSDTSPVEVTGFDFTSFAGAIPTIDQTGFSAYVAATHLAFVSALYAAAELVINQAAAGAKLKLDVPPLLVGGLDTAAHTPAANWSYATEARNYYTAVAKQLMQARADFILYGGWNVNPAGITPGSKLDSLRRTIERLEEERRFYDILITNLCTGGAQSIFS